MGVRPSGLPVPVGKPLPMTAEDPSPEHKKTAVRSISKQRFVVQQETGGRRQVHLSDTDRDPEVRRSQWSLV